MRRLILVLFILLGINVPDINFNIITAGHKAIDVFTLQKEQKGITPMKALDLVKERYAANFDKIYEKNSEDKYYYKLTFADYYLAYEDEVGTEKDYLIHLYEFVLDDEEAGIGHFVTYGWYTVDRENAEITELTYY